MDRVDCNGGQISRRSEYLGLVHDFFRDTAKRKSCVVSEFIQNQGSILPDFHCHYPVNLLSFLQKAGKFACANWQQFSPRSFVSLLGFFSLARR